MGYNFKNIRVVALVRVEVNQTFLKVHSENLVKVTRIGKVIPIIIKMDDIRQERKDLARAQFGA